MIPFAHVLFASALLAAWIAFDISVGWFTGVLVLLIWGIVFNSAHRPKTLGIVCGFLLLGFCLTALLTFPGINGPPVSSRALCQSNMKNIMIALEQYHDDHGSFPPAYIADENGKPMHSWRVLLLPYLDAAALYRAYDFEKPWDSRENKELIQHFPDLYTCPSHAETAKKGWTTSYLAVVGPQTAWREGESSRQSELKDDPSLSLMLIEYNSDFPWTAPQDLTVQEAVDVLTNGDSDSMNGHKTVHSFVESSYGRNLGFADGHAQFAALGIDRDLSLTLITTNDGLPEAGFDLQVVEGVIIRRRNHAKIVAFSIAIFLTLLPLPWVWIHPGGTTSRRDELPKDETQQS